MLNTMEQTVSIEKNPSFETKEKRERRRNLGIYYTPPEAAKVLARWTIRSPKDTLLEPSFGGCAMLAAAVSVFKSLGNLTPSQQLFGYDIDQEAFEYLSQLGIHNHQGNFKKENFLLSKPSHLKVDAILANPPFVSHHRQNNIQRELNDTLKKKYFPELPKFASLWAYFVLHSMSFLKPGGRMAFVLPNAVATAGYGKALLKFLSGSFERVEVVHVTERIFIQTGVDERIVLLLLTGYKPAPGSHFATIETRHVVKVSEIDINRNKSESLPDNKAVPDIRIQASRTLSTFVGKELVELGTVATVRIGEVVGNIPFFVRPLSAWRAEGIDKKFLFPLFTRAVQSDGIYLTDELLKSSTSRVPYLLLPPQGKLPIAIKRYLEKYPQGDIIKNATFQRREIWYRCSYNTDANAFIGSMNHEWAKIISNEGKASCSNSYYKITLKEKNEIAEWLPILSLTTPFRLSAEILGRVRGSGGIKLEPSDVIKLCIPAKLPQLSSGDLRKLCKQLDGMISNNELDAASQLADSVIFLKTALIDSKKMFEMRQLRLALTARRFHKP